MKKLPILHIIIFLLFSFLILLVQYTPAYSSPEDELENKIEETQEEIEEKTSVLGDIEARIKEIKNSDYTVAQKINLLSSEIKEMEEEIDAKNEEIEKKLLAIEEKEKIMESKKESLASISNKLYRESRIGSVEFFFSNTRIDEVIQSLFIKRSAISVLKDEITEITGEFDNLLVLKQDLVEEKEELDVQKEDLDESHDLLLAERAKLQRELNEKYNSRNLIARTINGLKSELSDLQYHLLVVRQGGTSVNLDSVPSSGDYNSTLAGFKEKAPKGSFAVFSIGAYTHRNGMSQWGARARADAGQTYTQILSHYYPGLTLKQNYPEPETIRVKGWGLDCNYKDKYYDETMSFTTYLNRIFEMPGKWNINAVKSQAIAARSYAIYKINTQGYLIPNQSNQVYRSCDNIAEWRQAVSETKGQVLTNGSTATLVQYAAVHGGWSNTSSWDTTDGAGGDNWMSKAYDSISGVSWFYKSWYRQTYSDSSSTCSRYPWLSQTEMSDIVNAAQVLKATGGDSRIVPVFDSCHSSGNPYSHTQLRNLAAKKVSSITAVVTSSSNGSTQTITFYTNAGTVSMSGNEFKTAYNVRAPGHLRIPQNGFVHINVEKK